MAAANATIAGPALARRQAHTDGQPHGNDDFHWLLSTLRLVGGEAPR